MMGLLFGKLALFKSRDKEGVLCFIMSMFKSGKLDHDYVLDDVNFLDCMFYPVHVFLQISKSFKYFIKCAWDHILTLISS